MSMPIEPRRGASVGVLLLALLAPVVLASCHIGDGLTDRGPTLADSTTLPGNQLRIAVQYTVRRSPTNDGAGARWDTIALAGTGVLRLVPSATGTTGHSVDIANSCRASERDGWSSFAGDTLVVGWGYPVQPFQVFRGVVHPDGSIHGTTTCVTVLSRSATELTGSFVAAPGTIPAVMVTTPLRITVADTFQAHAMVLTGTGISYDGGSTWSVDDKALRSVGQGRFVALVAGPTIIRATIAGGATDQRTVVIGPSASGTGAVSR
jgi:hypothetical protein